MHQSFVVLPSLYSSFGNRNCCYFCHSNIQNIITKTMLISSFSISILKYVSYFIHDAILDTSTSHHKILQSSIHFCYFFFSRTPFITPLQNRFICCTEVSSSHDDQSPCNNAFCYRYLLSN